MRLCSKEWEHREIGVNNVAENSDASPACRLRCNPRTEQPCRSPTTPLPRASRPRCQRSPTPPALACIPRTPSSISVSFPHQSSPAFVASTPILAAPSPSTHYCPYSTITNSLTKKIITTPLQRRRRCVVVRLPGLTRRGQGVGEPRNVVVPFGAILSGDQGYIAGQWGRTGTVRRSPSSRSLA